MTQHGNQGGIVRSADGRTLGVISDDGDRLLVRDIETDEARWVMTSDVTVVSSAATMTKWEPSDRWEVHHDIHQRGRDSFPTIDGGDLQVGDRVEARGGTPVAHLIIGDGIGVVESFEWVGGSIHLGLRPAGMPHSWTTIPLVQARKVG